MSTISASPQPPTALAQPPAAENVAVFSILKSHEFRLAYHQAVDQADVAPAARETTARQILEAYFGLEAIAPSAPLDSSSVYFSEHPIDVHGHAKFLLPGDVHRDLIPGPLFRLTPKDSQPKNSPPQVPSTQPLIDAHEFGRAISAVEAVRLSLIPERINSVLSFIQDAKKFYANGDVDNAERAMRTAMDQFQRASDEGLRRIPSEAERNRRANEVAGTRRNLTLLRKKIQEECHDHGPTGAAG